MKDLRSVSCDIMTIGQYLQPHARRFPVERYVTAGRVCSLARFGMEMGFKHVESSPLTRSSYHARQQAADPVGLPGPSSDLLGPRASARIG